MDSMGLDSAIPPIKVSQVGLLGVYPYLVLYTLWSTLPETNIAHTNRPSQKETIIFQPSIFRCELLVSERVLYPKVFSGAPTIVKDGPLKLREIS